MSKKTHQRDRSGEESQDTNKEPSDATPKARGDEAYEVTIDRETDRLVIKDPKSGNEITLFARVNRIEDEEEEEDEPLTPDEFREALQMVQSLGLTWTADRVPAVRVREEQTEEQTDEALFTEDVMRLQRKYPQLPRELGLVVVNALTGATVPAKYVGGKEDLNKKIEITNELVITPEYKSEFFFKRSIKVPYLEDIDWEIVFKLVENNVKSSPGISYALLSLIYHHPSIGGGRHRHDSMTVAVDSDLVDKLIHILSNVKKGLEMGAALTKRLHHLKPQKGEDNADTNPQDLE